MEATNEIITRIENSELPEQERLAEIYKLGDEN